MPDVMPHLTFHTSGRQPLLPPALRPLVFCAAVYGKLISDCLSLYESTARDIERHCGIDENEILRRGIRSCPTFSHNLIGAAACADRFGDLSTVPGFYLCDDHWRIDINPRLAQRGFVVPLRSARLGFIESLKIFRHAEDKQPFTLKVRRLEEAA